MLLAAGPSAYEIGIPSEHHASFFTLFFRGGK